MSVLNIKGVKVFYLLKDHFIKLTIMPLFRITTKLTKNYNGINVEKGLHVDIPSSTYTNPVTTDCGNVVVDAFLRIHGIDLQTAEALNLISLDVRRLG